MLKRFHNKHEGETCVIMGNGPSLKDCPLELLDKYITFGANKVYKLKRRNGSGFVPNYYTVIDEHMIHNVTSVITQPLFDPDAMFIRRPYPVPGSYQINCVVQPGYSVNINNAVVMGGTVTYGQIQIADYMGFDIALLVGVDHDYGDAIPASPGAVFVAEGEDQAHFDPEYFTPGEIYAAPELEGSLQFYRFASDVWKAKDKRIINLTPGTKETAFEKGTYDDWLG